MHLYLLKLDFHHTPVALREKVAFLEPVIPAALAELCRRGAREAAILSTCNRVEVYAILPSPSGGRALLATFLAEWHRFAPGVLDPHLESRTGRAAVHHLLRVACGLESLVPGEMQILGQVRRAAELAEEAGTLGVLLRNTFDAAIRSGRRARAETTIARRPVSISHAAVTLIRQQLGNDLTGRQILLIGSGKMGTIAAQQLHSAGATRVMVANRTLDSACVLARRWNGRAFSLEQIPRALAVVDAVISATAAPHFILSVRQIAKAMEARQGRGLLLVDLAVPRDVDPSVAAYDGVILRDIDSLRSIVEENIRMRNEERAQVREIIREELDRWMARHAARRAAPTIVSLRRSAEEIRRAELERVLRRLEHLSEEEQAIVAEFSRGLMNKFLHEPTVRLREVAATRDADRFRKVVEQLFALQEEAR